MLIGYFSLILTSHVEGNVNRIDLHDLHKISTFSYAIAAVVIVW